jgi:tetratricopeptide (TPR) repeat protein
LDSGVSTNTGNDTERLRRQARQHAQARQWAEARPIYAALLQHVEEDEEALLGLAQTLDMLGDYSALLAIARTAARINPGSASALAYQARALQKLERLSEATIANDQALLLDTNLALAWFNRGGQQLLQGHYPEALRYTERALELDSSDARAWANKGMALANLDRQYEALEAANESLARDPDYLIALSLKGEILRRYGRLEEAAQTTRHALEIDPTMSPRSTSWPTPCAPAAPTTISYPSPPNWYSSRPTASSRGTATPALCAAWATSRKPAKPSSAYWS